MTELVFLFALAAVLAFAGHAGGWSRGLGIGLACATVAALLLPAMARLF